jgi:hypothetical protein
MRYQLELNEMSRKSEGSDSSRRKNVTIARVKIIAYSLLFLVMLVFVIGIFIAKMLAS